MGVSFFCNFFHLGMGIVLPNGAEVSLYLIHVKVFCAGNQHSPPLVQQFSLKLLDTSEGMHSGSKQGAQQGGHHQHLEQEGKTGVRALGCMTFF